MIKLLGIFLFFFAFLSNGQTVSITSSATGAVCAGTSVTFLSTQNITDIYNAQRAAFGL
jgi:hypothetical protein